MENVTDGSSRVDIHFSVNPELELRLDSPSVPGCVPNAGEFDGARPGVGHAKFIIFSEAGETTRGALLVVEYTREDHTAAAAAAWRFVVVPGPVLESLAKARAKLAAADGAEAIRRRAETGGRVFDRGL